MFVKNGQIVPEKPNHALEVDLEGYTLFPGLVNAHDHLELNHFPRTKFREVYNNAHQWGEDVNARLNDEPFKTLRSYPLWDRVFIGGLKNLLCGATTVVHHGPPHKPMYRKDFPVRVLKNYGWVHSLHFNTEEEIIRSYKNTPKDVPWFIHLAEGTDEIAAGEYQRLKKLGCVGSNTVIVHGIGMTHSDVRDAMFQCRGLICCPSTNQYLLHKISGQESDSHHDWFWTSDVALGSDSRLTGSGDLLDEMKFALQNGFTTDDASNLIGFAPTSALYLLWTVTVASPIQGGYRLDLGGHFDGIITASNEHIYATVETLCLSGRKDLKLVIREGIPRIGDPELMAKFPHIQTVACILDGVEKRMNVDLARQVHRCKLNEQGLDVDDLPSGKRFIFF